MRREQALRKPRGIADEEEDPQQQPRDVWLPDSSVIEGATPDEGEEPTQTTVSEVPPEPDELPQPSAPLASADDSFRPPPAPAPTPQQQPQQDDGGGYDWKRALSSLFGGQEGLSAYDRQRLAEASARLKAKQDATELKLKVRKDAREQAAQDALLPGKAAKLGAETRGTVLRNDALDPNSDQSKAAVGLMASRIEAKAATMPDGPIKDLMTKFVTQARQAGSPINALQASQWADKFGVDVSDVMRGIRADRAQGEVEQQNDEKNKQAWARINMARQKSQEPKGPSERVKAAQAKNQDKLDDEIEKAEWAKSMLLRVADLKQRVNTGPLAGRAQNAMQTVGLSSADFDNMKQTLAMVSNRIIKELSGSAVTGNEWARMQDELANIINDDQNFSTKLANMIDLTDSIKQRAINRYTRGEEGAPVIPSNTARRVTAQAPRVIPGETPPPDATPGRDPDLAAKVNRAKQILDDPNESPEKKAKAERWLKAHAQ